MIVLVLGGTRSGKTAIAERVAVKLAGDDAVTYVATGIVTDPDMAARIDAHRARRSARWTTVETAGNAGMLVPTLAALDGVALVDSIGAWVAHAQGFAADVTALVRTLPQRRGHTVLVSEEVGLSVHAPSDAGRKFADMLGDTNRAIAAIADECVFVVAGRVVPLAADDSVLERF